MNYMEQLRAVLEAGVESLTVDFKERLDWGTSAARLELVRDIVCLANRNGGLLVIGASDNGNGTVIRRGLAAGESMPDPTEIGQLARRHFDPPPRFTSTEAEVDGIRFGIVVVEEFDRTPIVCRAIGNDQSNRAVFRPGDLFRRSDALECRRIDSANELQELLEAGVSKTGLATIRMASSLQPPQPLPAHHPSTATSFPARDAGSTETLRTFDAVPQEPASMTITQILDRVSSSVVRSHSGVMVPRSIDPARLEPSAIIREPGRIIIERTQEDMYGRASSFIEVSTALQVRLREGLWEDEGQVDYTSLFAYPLSALLFLRDFYADTDVRTLTVRYGLTQPIGRRLVDDPRRYSGFFRTYVATSSVDLVVDRVVRMDELADPVVRVDLAVGMSDELVSYFGFLPNPDARAAHLKNSAAAIPGLLE
jgi:hypothetical protein